MKKRFIGGIVLLAVFIIMSMPVFASEVSYINNVDITDKLMLEGDAEYDANEQAILLCPAQTWSNGKAKYPFKILDDFEVTFDYKIGGGTSADGLMLAFFAQKDTVTQDGEDMNFSGSGGYGLEFDTYRNTNDSQNAHVAIVHDVVSNHLVSVDEPRVDDEQWHKASINVTGNNVIVSIDGDVIISQNIDFDKTNDYIYFAASTGSCTDDHYIKNVKFTGNAVFTEGFTETEIVENETEISNEPNTVTTSFGATVSSWAASEIELAFENDLIPEIMLDYDLTKKVNRGEFAAIALQLYETLTSSETSLPPSCSFTDISGDINEQAIKKAYGIQITAGTSTTTFEPISFITREQLATMLCRVIKKYGFKDWTLETDDDYYMNTDGAKKFADDADISDWAKPSVYYMSLHGIIYGIDETHFAPKNTTTQQEALGYATATREQAILLAQRIFTKSDMLGN